MPQTRFWEKEYQNPKLITGHEKPQNFIIQFKKKLKKQGVNFNNLKILDLGSGTGRNANYFASLGAEVFGIEISATAIKIAQKRALEEGLKANYTNASIGKPFPFKNAYFDLILDITSSNSLNEAERSVYLEETSRVLKKGGLLFSRTLAKDGDQNAKKLLRNYPGKEKDTYIIPELGLSERVFQKDDLINTYSKYFDIIELKKETSYTKFANQSYRRNFWLMIAKNKQ